MRHLFIILDLSETMRDQDLKPNRLYCVLKVSVQQYSLKRTVCYYSVATEKSYPVDFVVLTVYVFMKIDYCKYK